MQNEQQLDMEEEENEGGFKAWLEDNLRIILSILVVFAIAGGIYSYSQRSQAPVITEETTSSQEEGDEPKETEDDTVATNGTETDSGNVKIPDETEEKPGVTASEEEKPEIVKSPSNSPESKETETSFIETAGRGDGATHLARRALASYLEKNPDSTLSREHKIYIEDYLRKHVSYGHVKTGSSLEFSKSLVQEAIGKSKQLTGPQLSNLKKYSSRAPSLR